MHYKTIVLSDLHLGTKDCKSKEVAKFLKANSCNTLILNGDIIDIWHLKRSGGWQKKDTRVIRRILKMIEKYDTRVIYVKGNHDDILEQFLPMQVGNFEIVEDMELKSGGKKYFVCHGDVFDVFSSKFKWVAKMGDLGYKFLLWLNRRYYKYRRLRGLPYKSISQQVKQRVKMAVSYVNDFEEVMVNFARSKNYDGIICGHIHQPDIKEIQGMTYMNSGDWVETMSALVEDFKENWEVVYYQTIIPDVQQEIEFPDNDQLLSITKKEEPQPLLCE